MNKEKLFEDFQRCLLVANDLPNMSTIEVNKFSGDWTITFRVWSIDKNDHKAAIAAASLLGKLTLDEDLYWLRGAEDGLAVDLIRDKPCKIVGYKTEKRPVLKTIDTGDFVETKIPVTDCDLRKGVVSVGDYEPVLEVA